MLGSRFAEPGARARGRDAALEVRRQPVLTDDREPRPRHPPHRAAHRLPRLLARAAARRAVPAQLARLLVRLRAADAGVALRLPVAEVPARTLYFEDASSVGSGRRSSTGEDPAGGRAAGAPPRGILRSRKFEREVTTQASRRGRRAAHGRAGHHPRGRLQPDLPAPRRRLRARRGGAAAGRARARRRRRHRALGRAPRAAPLYPKLAKHADDLCVINSMHTDLPNHSQAFLQMHTGSFQFVRPSVGAWTLYGLGTRERQPARASSRSIRRRTTAARGTTAAPSCPRSARAPRSAATRFPASTRRSWARTRSRGRR